PIESLLSLTSSSLLQCRSLLLFAAYKVAAAQAILDEQALQGHCCHREAALSLNVFTLGILNIVHSQVHVILSQFDIGLLSRNKFPSELMVREVKKKSTSVACSFMAVLFEQGLGFGPL
ncbi:hypothetical protein IFM89_005064, partial [Coptis chinensis]